MDRDAAPGAEVVPPFDWDWTRKWAQVGLGLMAAAAGLGLVANAMASVPSVVSTARLFLVFGGAIVAGSALSMRPDLWKAWALGTASAVLGVVGLPEHWDSFRILFGGLASVGLVGTVTLAAPARYRLPVISLWLLFHFSGIFFATTTPPATPWLTEQMFIRVYNPYLQFIYMRNAYHFYSPEPGPASVLAFLLKTETGTGPGGKKQYTTKWVVLPKRPADVKDPLGLTYYRRLSITEQLARVMPGLLQTTNVAEKEEMLARRTATTYLIPFAPEDQWGQYRLPQPEIARYVLPSYASHVILEYTSGPEEAARTTVKVYRLEHRTLNIEEFANTRQRPGANTNPYDPPTYRPYFLGEFNAHGTLLYPQDPFLYWHVPIMPRPGGVPPGSKDVRSYIDYLSVHALFNVIDTKKTDERGLPVPFSADDVDDPKYRDRVFDWNQLR